MAKISSYSAITGADTAADDVFAIVDISAGTSGSKKITRDELVKAVIESGLIRTQGTYDYKDSATSGTPITLSTTYTKLTNDNLGFNLAEDPVTGVPEVWDAATNKFIFSNLQIGDAVIIRFDTTITSGATTQLVYTRMSFDPAGSGGGPYYVPIDEKYFKTSGTALQFAPTFMMIVGSTDTQSYGGEIQMATDSGSATVVVNGWLVTVIPKKAFI